MPPDQPSIENNMLSTFNNADGVAVTAPRDNGRESFVQFGRPDSPTSIMEALCIAARLRTSIDEEVERICEDLCKDKEEGEKKIALLGLALSYAQAVELESSNSIKEEKSFIHYVDPK